MVVKVAAIIRTNVPGRSVQNEFLHKTSLVLEKLFFTETQHVTVEVQTDCLMVRGGSSAAMAIIQLYHNDDRCNDDNKHTYAKTLAMSLAEGIGIPKDRVLVLFHDTRQCSRSVSQSQRRI